MRVLVAVLVNLVLVTALTIASVHIQLSPLLNRLDWAYWVHKSLMLVCLAQFTMAAVWAATARGGRFGLWAHGMVLALACSVPMYIGLSGGHFLHTGRLIENVVPTFLVFETHCAIAIGWSGLFLVSLYAGRRFARRGSPETESVVDEPTGKEPQSRIAGVCSLMALGLVIGYGREILPMIDHWPYISDPGPSLWWWKQWAGHFLMPFGMILVPLAGLAVVSLMAINRAGPSMARLMFMSAKKEEHIAAEPSGRPSVGRHLRNPGVAILTVVSTFFFACHATGTVDQFKVRVLTSEHHRLFVNDRTMARLEQQTTLKGLNLNGLTISDSGLAHLRDFKDLETLRINPFGPQGVWLAEYKEELQGPDLQERLVFREFSPRTFKWEGWIELVLGSDVASPITDTGLENFKGLTKLKELDLSGLDITDKGLMFFAGNTNLGRLSLNHTRVTGTAFQSCDFPQLQSLHLSHSRITDEGLLHLKNLISLRKLYLYSTQITDEGLVHFKEMTNLESLILSSTNLTGSGMVHLKGMDNLKRLYCDKTSFTDAGLVHLKGLTSLQELGLSETQITDAGLLHLKGLAKLQSLNLAQSKVTDAGLLHLKNLTNLNLLYLMGTKVTDAGLVYLKDITSLGEVHLMGTNVTEEAVEELRKSRPGCMILWFPE